MDEYHSPPVASALKLCELGLEIERAERSAVLLAERGSRARLDAARARLHALNAKFRDVEREHLMLLGKRTPHE